VDGEGPQHQYGEPDSDFATWDEYIEFLDGIGCEFKEEEHMLACAHLSKGLFYGGKFTPLNGGRGCPECGYAPSAAQAKADLARFNALDDDEQKEERRRHVEGGMHWNQELFMGPLPKELGMRKCGNDQLHLIYLNWFKHLFKYTCHEPLPASKKKLVSEYLKAAGFYSYDAASDEDDPVKRWIGREVKRFLHEADEHLPFLLSLSSGAIDVGSETAAATNAAGEESMNLSDDEFAPTAEEIAAEAKREPLVVVNAARWDRFLNWARHIELPWGEDTDGRMHTGDSSRCSMRTMLVLARAISTI
jgi:hypothetical protein